MADSVSTWLLHWTPIYLLAVGFVVGLWRVVPGILERINERQRDKASERANDWTRLREEVARLDGRCQRIEASEEQCHNALAAAVHRIAELEGYMMGTGKAREDAAKIVAADRLEQRDKKGDGK